MVDTAGPQTNSDRHAQLKRLAEADFDDEVAVAEIRKRMKLRDLEREQCNRRSRSPDGDKDEDFKYHYLEAIVQPDVKEESDSHSEVAVICEPPSFEVLLEQFRDACDHMGPENALDCASCTQYPPDDPILTSCLCLYCTECFTELLAQVGKAGRPRSIPCAAYAEERVEFHMSLTSGQYDALGHIFDQHDEAPSNKWLPDKLYENDVNVLWRKCKSRGGAVDGDGDHSCGSPDLGDDSTELSSDGFDGESRSDGYEHDSGSETASQLGPITDYGCMVDPRHDASTMVAPPTEDKHSGCLRVSPSEVGDLKNDIALRGEPKQVDADAPPENVMKSPIHIDLTGGEDTDFPIPATEASQNDEAEHRHTEDEGGEEGKDSDEEEDEDHQDDNGSSEDDASVCQCDHCIHIRASPFF